MSPGQLARRVLGDRWFPVVGRYYRALFVDLAKVAASIPDVSPGARVLEIGGGDGQLMNLLVARFPDAHFTMIDLGPALGGALTENARARVEILPGTSVRDYRALGRPSPDIVIVSDVVHHIPAESRAPFFADIRDLVGGARSTVVVKDVAPGSIKARAAYLADRYVSGDRNVAFLPADDLQALVAQALPGFACRATDLFERDPPNYCLIFAPPR